MAGAFTHLIIVDVAKRSEQLPLNMMQLLNKHSEFLFLGSVSPDLPYLSYESGKVHWADHMHYKYTNRLVRNGVEELRSRWQNRDGQEEVLLAWLAGYIAHMVADATIHPIVAKIVGPYAASEKNKENHRICEMTQDSLVYKNHRNYDIQHSEFSSVLKFCKDSDHYEALVNFWAKHLKGAHEVDEAPDPDWWFECYTKALDVAEGSGVASLFRHMGIGTTLSYNTSDELMHEQPDLVERYYQQVKLPGGKAGTFEEHGFEKAVRNVIEAWIALHASLSAEKNIAEIVKNWNLDTGEDQDSPDREVTYWRV